MKNKFTRTGVLILALITFCVVTHAQSSIDYSSQWKNIDALINKGLTRTALTEVNTIYADAKKSGNKVQQVKALIYQLHLQQNITDGAALAAIKTLEKEITEASGLQKSILYSITAEYYFNYYQNNRWKILNRTSVEGSSDEIDTWSADKFHQKISNYYLRSIADEKMLQNVDINAYNAILVKGNTDYLWPTRYDLLANRAITYFNNDERDIQKPAYAFELNDEAVFSDAVTFIKHQFKTRDSLSLHFKALNIYQKLLQFHLHDAKPDALINVNIERLKFGKQYAIMENKTALYIGALQRIYDSNISDGVAQAGYLIAAEIYEQANAGQYDSLNNYSLAKARSVADSVYKKYPKSEGGIDAYNLIRTIDKPSLNLSTEKVNEPGKPFRTLITYKNIAGIYLRIIPVSQSLKTKLDDNREDNMWARLVAEKFIIGWQQNLPLPKDYRSHSVEIKVDQLPVGEYALLASASPDFNLNKNPLSLQYFYVSNISFINNNLEYFALHRESGQPLKGAAIQVWDNVYDYKTGKNTLAKKEKLSADNNGYFKIKNPEKDESRNIRLEISTKDDHLFLNDFQYGNQYYRDYVEDGYDAEDLTDYEKDHARVFLFTDRSIYRPGQTVYFKGIAVTRKLQSQHSIIYQSKDSLKFIFKDVNGSDVDSLVLKPNAFGSVTGTFKLPEGRLAGKFSIEVKDRDNSSVDFSVEEYKRPKFYAELEKLKAAYRLNDSITVTGFAKAYAGNNVNNAIVKYSVRRVARFLYPWLFWRWPMPQSRPMEITHGTITTDAEGKFNITFKAIPDLSIDKKTEPVFDYEIDVDITDAAGETRSTSTSVSIGYKSLELKIEVPGEQLSADSLKNILVSAKNLSGEKAATNVTLKITFLKSPQRLIRSKYWEQPDQFVMTREEFEKFFPVDDYNNDLKKESWAKGETLVELKDSANKPLSSLNKNLTPGWYVIEAFAKDKDGFEVKDIKYVFIQDDKKPSLTADAYKYISLTGSNFQPGDKATIIAGSAAKNVFMIREDVRSAVKNGKDSIESSYTFDNISNSLKNYEYTIKEDDRGGFTVNHFFVKDNRAYTNSQFVNVPWLNKQLDVSYTTFRDKTLPGSKEKWKVKINGYKGEKVAAEMLAAMYDASLDQFKEHSWLTPDIWPSHHVYDNWNGQVNFSSVTSNDKWIAEKYLEQKEKIFTNFLFVESLRYGNRVLYKVRGIASDAMRESQSANAPELQEVVVTALGVKKGNQFTPPKVVMSKEMVSVEKQSPQLPGIITRKKFNETAFFFPQLNTDKDGNVEFSFTVPEALTTWKLLTLAHTKELAFGYNERSLITQKDLMIQANAPRFLREGDRMEFSANITNLTDKEITGQAELQLLSASSLNPIDGLFKNVFPSQYFTIEAGKTEVVKFTMEVPFNFTDAMVYRIIAKAGNNTDGEEAAIPVLTNRMLVTETLPLNVNGDSVKHFTFDKLLSSATSETLKSHALTVEYSSNLAWYAIQALPYLNEVKYECADYLFNSYYANTLAGFIMRSSPKIAEVFEWWRKDTINFKSNLQKNEELKSVLLQETPWLLEAANETAQMHNLATLFDAARINLELNTTFDKLKEWQSPGGGFVWFKGGREDRYITQYIVNGLARLINLKAIGISQQAQVKDMIAKALPYLDAELKKDFDNLKRNNKAFKITTPYLPPPITAQYFYLRSLLPGNVIPENIKPAYNYYRNQLKTNWLKENKYAQAMIALALNRTGDKNVALSIIKSLKENAVYDDELGMYWKEWDNHGYYWYQAPIESQAMMIEAFTEITNDVKAINDLKTWLLKNKQTNSWSTSKATADACYALLLKGTDVLNADRKVTIALGAHAIESDKQASQAGTGYFKFRFPEKEVEPSMGNISVKVTPSSNTTTWGAAYWQYFEDLDKITFATTPLKLDKKLFVTTATDRGRVLTAITNQAQMKVGDKITVRIELRVDRDMEYVHMKDMRAACMEPVNVLSSYKYQGGLGYYESTGDAATNFFFNYLPKGTYVFEYKLNVTHTGNFSNGITSIQCMYAPEFTSHSNGTRVNVE